MTATFKKHIEEMHPSIADDSPPPDRKYSHNWGISIYAETSTKKEGIERECNTQKGPRAASHDTVVGHLTT